MLENVNESVKELVKAAGHWQSHRAQLVIVRTIESDANIIRQAISLQNWYTKRVEEPRDLSRQTSAAGSREFDTFAEVVFHFVYDRMLELKPRRFPSLPRFFEKVHACVLADVEKTPAKERFRFDEVPRIQVSSLRSEKARASLTIC